jgi:kynureninase
MPREFVPHLGAASWQVSGPPILAMIPLRASLEIFREAGIDRLRERAGRLTAYLQDLLDDIAGVRIVTPRATEERGAMLCLRVLGRSQAVQDALARRGVVLDVREPDTLRLALAPLYNTFEEAWRLSVALREVLAELEPAIDDPS